MLTRTLLPKKAEHLEIGFFLKIDGKGWDIKLFDDRDKLSACICANCGAVCCDVVELGCDHNDDDIFLYCNDCLKDLINHNNNTCPINGHIDPVIIPNRSSRRQISKAVIVCPQSVQYKLLCKEFNNNNNDGHIIDTMGEEKEGDQNIAAYHQNKKPNRCKWKGTIYDLINNHLLGCEQKYNPTFALNIKIDKLQKENQKLNQQVFTLQNEMKHKDKLVIDLLTDINNKNMIINTLENKINIQNGTKQFKEKLKNKQIDLNKIDGINKNQKDPNNKTNTTGSHSMNGADNDNNNHHRKDILKQPAPRNIIRIPVPTAINNHYVSSITQQQNTHPPKARRGRNKMMELHSSSPDDNTLDFIKELNDNTSDLIIKELKEMLKNTDELLKSKPISLCDSNV